jgi:outer membrane lipoprotein-sorting protein
MNFKVPSLFWGLVLFCAVSTAGGLAELDIFLKSTDAGVLIYSQTTFRKKFDGAPRSGETKARAEFFRPYSFRIEYEPPNEYVLVGNGKTVTVHDPKLMSTTIYEQKSMIGESLVPLLEARAISAMSGAYDFRESSANGFEWAVVTPLLGKASTFEKISFGFQRNELTRLEIIQSDGDKQVYRISWESLEPPDPSRFNYSPPAGSDYEDKSDQTKPTSGSDSVQ